MRPSGILEEAGHLELAHVGEQGKPWQDARFKGFRVKGLRGVRGFRGFRGFRVFRGFRLLRGFRGFRGFWVLGFGFWVLGLGALRDSGIEGFSALRVELPWGLWIQDEAVLSLAFIALEGFGVRPMCAWFPEVLFGQ